MSLIEAIRKIFSKPPVTMPSNFDAEHSAFMQKHVDAISAYCASNKLTDDDLQVFLDVWEMLPADMALELWSKVGSDSREITRHNLVKIHGLEIISKIFFAVEAPCNIADEIANGNPNMVPKRKVQYVEKFGRKIRVK